ncbi:hypothetical protein NP233_g7591 [Leucocoprinus birnbaumii]|uniref:DUF6534 domain-containing protein n=1 Tax=Leucocoprinus birnbaumii TaxID=56174 RepID=A0AAD5VQJ2_9AGAR|nr:hypothetical protein NP233_g7591 [Leucocoprinus birnbaumii]
MSPTSTPLPDNASLVLGPPIVGVALNWYLYGILTLQYFMYLSNSRHKDGLLLRGIVHFLFLLDTAQTFMIMDDAFFWFVYNFGDFSALFSFNLASIDGPVLDAIITFTVQLVYCWRLWKLGKWRVLPILSAALALISCVSGMTAGIHSILSPTHIKAAENLWLFATAITDILIATSMTHLLVKYRKEGAVAHSTMAVIKRVLILTLETNAITAAVAIALVTSFLVPSVAPPKTNVYMTLGYILGKLYSNCFMVLLNQRIYYDAPGRTRGEIGTLSSTSHGTILRGAVSQNEHNRLSDLDQPKGQISVVQFTETRGDDLAIIEMD